MRISLIIFICLLLGRLLTAQSNILWPGDVNNNGIVDGVDFIYYGVAYGSTGPERPNATDNWVPQEITPWATDFPNGINYAFGDIEGDGEVDNSDQSKFEQNWGLTHGTLQPDEYAPSQSGAPLKIHLEPNVTVAGPGNIINVDIKVGSAEQPVNEFYGYAFKLTYTTSLVNNGGSDFDFNELPSSWADPTGEDARHFLQKNEINGRAETGLTRTNQQTVSGFGSTGSFSIIIEDIIVGLFIDTFRIEIDSVVVMGTDLQPIMVEGDTTEVLIVAPGVNAVDQSNHPVPPIKIAPVPVRDYLDIHSEQPIEHLRIYNAQGRTLFSQHGLASSIAIPVGHWPRGTYWIQGTHSNGPFARAVTLE
jgi:hypothetical protein